MNETIHKFLLAGDSKHIYQNALDKVCFQNDMCYVDFKDLNRKTADGVLRDKVLSTAKNPKYNGYQHIIASMVYKFFDKNFSTSGIKNEKISNKELAEKLTKPIIRKCEKRKICSTFVNNNWDADRADMELISEFSIKILVFCCILLIFIANIHRSLL